MSVTEFGKSTNNIDEYGKRAIREKLVIKYHILYDSIYIKCLEKANL